MSQKKLKVLFFGTPGFALPALESCHKHAELLALVCQPDRPRGRGQKTLPCETRSWAHQNQIPSFAPVSLKKDSPEKTELVEYIKKHEPDLFVVVAYGNLLPQDFLDMPKYGAINIHASLLPKWRGAAPIQRSLEAGDPITGVCIQKMELALDAGNVLAESAIKSENMDALELSDALSKKGAELLPQVLESCLVNSDLPEGKKQDPGQVSFANKIAKEEGFYRYSWTSEQLCQRIRGFRAWPQVKLVLPELGEAKLLQAEVSNQGSGLKEGSLYLKNQQVFLACVGNSSCELLLVQCAGKAPASAYSVLQNLLSKSGQTHLRVLEIS